MLAGSANPHEALIDGAVGIIWTTSCCVHLALPRRFVWDFNHRWNFGGGSRFPNADASRRTSQHRTTRWWTLTKMNEQVDEQHHHFSWDLLMVDQGPKSRSDILLVRAEAWQAGRVVSLIVTAVLLPILSVPDFHDEAIMLLMLRSRTIFPKVESRIWLACIK
jgi:hypothetical protein